MIPANGARMSVLASFASASCIVACATLIRVLGLVLRLPRDVVAVGEVDRAVELGLGEREIGLGLRVLRVGDRRVELHERRALGDALALLERDRADASGGLRAQRHRLVGAQAADGGDRLRHRRGHDLDGFHGDARAARLCAPPLAGAVAAGADAGCRRALGAHPVSGAGGADRDGHGGGDCNGSTHA